MKFSVIIPSFNSKKTIEECIKSILNQHYSKKNYEVIVIDDGSTDNSLDLIKKYSVKIIRQKNKGPAVARNVGAKYASGKYLVFTDSDCVVDKYWLKSIDEGFKEYHKISGIGGEILNGNCSLMGKVSHLIDFGGNVDNKEGVIKTMSIPSANICYKRDIFREIGGFNEKLVTMEDRELNWRLVKNGYKILCYPKVKVYHYANISFFNLIKKRFNRAKTFLEARKLHRDMPLQVYDRSKIIFFFLLPCYIGGTFIRTFLSNYAKKLGYHIFLIPFLVLILDISFWMGITGGILRKK